jgi:serine/threonine protein kinase
MIGKTLGHYRIVEKIGAGGMGEVYRAHDERLERDVALKVLPSGTLADESARKRFRKEALTLSKLNHPHIAHVYDFDTQEGADFLVMEYVTGATLKDKLAEGPLPEKAISRLGAQVADALEAAHEQGIVHRDLKPGNIALTDKGQAKVLDFGLAKLAQSKAEVAEAATVESLTQTVGVAGTLPYMAPEQLRGEGIDGRSDLYSFGVMLYEMATGRRPFEEKLSTALSDAILHRAPPSPCTVNRRVSAGLENIILKCLEKEPERRYQSAKEMRIDLERLGGSPSRRPHQLCRQRNP